VVISIAVASIMVLRLRSSASPPLALSAQNMALLLCAASILNSHLHSYDLCIFWASLMIAVFVVPKINRYLHVAVLTTCAILLYLDPLYVTQNGAIQPATIGMMIAFLWMHNVFE